MWINHKSKLITSLVILLLILGVSPHYRNSAKLSNENQSSHEEFERGLKDSAITPLTLNTLVEDDTVYDNNPLNYSITLNAGSYLVHVNLEEVSLIDITIEIATDSAFSTIINTTNELGVGGDERTIINTTITDTFYIRVSCPSGSDWIDIIVTPNLSYGYTKLYLGDTDDSGDIDVGESFVFYINAPAKELEITVLAIFLNIMVNISDDPLLRSFYISKDEKGVGNAETITKDIEEAKTIYIKVYGISGLWSDIEITISEVSSGSSNDDDDDDDDDATTNPNFFTPESTLITLIALSAIGISTSSVYLIRRKKVKKKTSLHNVNEIKTAPEKLKTKNLIENHRIVQVFSGDNTLENLSQIRYLNLTLLSKDYCDKVDEFDWDEEDKRNFIREMQALPKKRRDQILYEMAKMTRYYNKKEASGG